MGCPLVRKMVKPIKVTGCGAADKIRVYKLLAFKTEP